MDLLENSFFVLGASTRDNRQRISELHSERSLTVDLRECNRARSELTNPRKRLSAEVAWVPGLGPKRTDIVLSILMNEVSSILDVVVPKLAKANLLAAGLSRTSGRTSDVVAEWILELAWAYEEIDLEQLGQFINEDRVVSGFPAVSDLSVLAEAIGERRLYYQQVLRTVLNSLTPSDLVETVTLIVRIATLNGERHGPVLLDDLVDSFEIEIRESLDHEAANIEQTANAIRSYAMEYAGSKIPSSLTNQLSKLVKKWDEFAQPIQVSTLSRGLDHEASSQIAGQVRSLSIELYHKYNNVDDARLLTNLLGEVFSEVAKIEELVARDLVELDNHHFHRGRDNAVNGQYEEALKNFNRMLILRPDFGEAYFWRGLVKVELEKFTAAIVDYDHALRLEPDSAVVYGVRGRAKAELKQYHNAISDYDRALQYDSLPEPAPVYQDRALAKVALGWHEAAIADFDQALRHNPESALTYYQRAMAKIASERHAAAISDLDQFLHFEPNVGVAYIQRGFARIKIGSYRDAIDDFDVALHINDRIAEAYFGRGLAKEHLGYSREAQYDYEQAVSLDPDFVNFLSPRNHPHGRSIGVINQFPARPYQW